MITLRENGYVIALAPVFTQTAEKLKAASAVEIQNHKENKIDSDRTLSIKDAAEASNTTTVRYADVFSSVDVEYLLSGNDIKENIIVNDAQNEYTYSFALAVVNLTPELKPTGEIVLSDSSTGTEEYWIPAPYMYDANGEVSYDVSYELSGAKGAYILRVVAEKKWINSDDRAFPVVIDPTIKKTILYDTYISSAAPTTNYGTSSELWISSGKISFLKQEMPTLPDGCEFHAAKLYVYYYYYDKVTDGSLTAGAYQVLHSWSESGTSGLTWNMASPSTNTYISSTRLSAGPFSGSRGAYANSPKTVSFDVTSAAEAWYEGTSPNYGIALKYEGGTNSSVILKSCEAGSLYRAYYIITYTEPEIVSGVYKIKNAANGLYLDVDNGGATAGTRVQQWSTATEANKRNQLFKITFVQTYDTNTKLNYYTIRPMTNSALGLETALSGSRNATISTMSVNDSWAELTGNQLWAISKDGSYYTLKNGMPSANSYLTAPASATNGEAVYTADSAGTTSQWILEPYTGEALNGVRKLSGALNLITGEELTYQICMYSSAVGVNGPVRYSVKNTDGTATDKATIEESTGHLTALKPGQIKIRATYTGAPYIWSWTATIEESMEGTWFIQNRHESLYMQVDDDDEPNYANDGGIAEVRSFDGADYQRWIFTNAGDGYYKITSKISGYAVTVPSGEESEEDVDLVLKPYTGSNNQKWKITLTSYGSYKIKAKSSESITDRDLVMVVQTNILYSEGLNIQQRQYVDNTSYKDEWELIRMLPTNGYELQYSPSSWTSYAQNCCNCYAYALNNQVYPGTNSLWFKQQMGYYKGSSYTYTTLTETNISTAVANDYDAYNSNFDVSYVFRKIGRYDVCPAGTYKVALVASDSDYHWYRQDSDGLWSHKRGLNPVERTDYSGNLIIDPYIADRGTYTEFLGYYAVTPWNNMFCQNGTVTCYYWGMYYNYTDLMNQLGSLSYSRRLSTDNSGKTISEFSIVGLINEENKVLKKITNSSAITDEERSVLQ